MSMMAARLARGITWRYLIALTLIACLATTTCVLVITTAQREESRSEVINLVGSQRTLSQRIAFFANALTTAENAIDREQYAKELAKTIRVMERAHDRLTLNVADPELPRSILEGIQSIYFDPDTKFDTQVRQFLDHARQVLEAEPEDLNANHYELLALNMAGTVYIMQTHDLMVRMLQYDGEQAIALVRRLELILWATTLFLLFLEAMVIFRPMVRRVRAATEQLEEEQARAQEAAETAEKASAAKTSFLAMMSHEIRTPLNSMIGMTTLMLDSGLDEKQRDFAYQAKLAGEHLLRVINDILDFSKLEAGKVELEEMPFDLVNEVETCLSIMGPVGQRKGLPVAAKYDDAARAVFLGDGGRLRQVLMNFIGNAIKFTEHGAVTVVVAPDHTREAQEPGRRWFRIEVRDTGIGIPADRLECLFQDFTQADTSTTRRFGGTGLGLAISRRLVEAMGGEIGAESTEGVGSTFWCVLPLREAPQAAAPAAPAAKATPRPTRAKAALVREGTPEGLDILLVEDNTANQIVATAFLDRLGHKVTIANNGREAIEKLDEHAFELVLMDVNMPEMDGITATGEIRKRPGPDREIPIIGLTAHAFRDEQQALVDAGMDDYLPKPIDMKELGSKLAQWRAHISIKQADEAAVSPERTPSATMSLADHREALAEARRCLGEAAGIGSRADLRQIARQIEATALSVGAHALCLVARAVEEGESDDSAAEIAALEAALAEAEDRLEAGETRLAG